MYLAVVGDNQYLTLYWSLNTATTLFFLDNWGIRKLSTFSSSPTSLFQFVLRNHLEKNVIFVSLFSI